MYYSCDTIYIILDIMKNSIISKKFNKLIFCCKKIKIIRFVNVETEEP